MEEYLEEIDKQHKGGGVFTDKQFTWMSNSYRVLELLKELNTYKSNDSGLSVVDRACKFVNYKRDQIFINGKIYA
jgi:hypothetical protein